MGTRNAFYPLLLLAFSGCNLLSGKCTYELRSLDAAGTINENGAELVSAQITLSEERGSLQDTSMQWLLTGSTLKGHVLVASFKDASDLSKARLDLPLASADRPEIGQGFFDTRAGANLGGIRDLLAAGHGVIELQTDIPSRPTITLPLTATRQGDWIRPNCS
jgi:hypothetical protein